MDDSVCGEREYCRAVCLEAAFFANFSFSFLFNVDMTKQLVTIEYPSSGKNMPATVSLNLYVTMVVNVNLTPSTVRTFWAIASFNLSIEFVSKIATMSYNP